MYLSLLKMLVVVIAIVPLTANACDNCSPEDLTYLTEQYPPHNFSENGQLKGISVELLAMIWKGLDAKLSIQDIKMVPWARGIRNIQHRNNIVLFGMGYSTERAKTIQWVGPYLSNDLVLIGKKSNQSNLTSLEEAKQFRIGVIRDDAADQHLRNQGFDPSNIEQVNTMGSLFRMLRLDRIPLIGSTKRVFFENTNQYDIQPEEYEVKFVLREIKSGYGFSKAIPSDLVKRFQTELDKLTKDGTVERVVRKYMNE